MTRVVLSFARPLTTSFALSIILPKIQSMVSGL